MKQFVSDRASIAWFKLAEFVARGEKERALSIFRLLMYSINEPALIAQLEGDILYAFNDEDALKSYLKAADLYKKKQQPIHAVAIYEHITNRLVPDSSDYRKEMISLYEELSQQNKVFGAVQKLVDILLKKGLFSQAHDIIRAVKLPNRQKAPLHEQLVVGILTSSDIDRGLVSMHIAAALDGYNEDNDEGPVAIKRFFSELSALDEKAFGYAQRYVSD